MKPFIPLLRNAHVATIAGSLWPREIPEQRFPVEAKIFHTEPEVRILVHIQRPPGNPLGEAVLVHGLEGSSHSGYMISLAEELLYAGYVVHRMNIRSCGGTEFFCKTLYHAGLTHDLFAYLMDLDRQRRTPVHLIGFSLGGNQVLKLAGEMGRDAERLLASVCAVSTPIDLAACAMALEQRSNFLYEWWFLRQMRSRLALRKKVIEAPVPWDRVSSLKTMYEFDDLVTGPSFGFRGAEHYYSTQSASNFLASIRVPALLIQAKDDPMIPFDAFERAAETRSRFVKLEATEWGGHAGFISRGGARFWLDGAIQSWLAESRAIAEDRLVL
ncbi:MAG: alpha/beta fold hydrolase [Bryobacteraceae bacterium]